MEEIGLSQDEWQIFRDAWERSTENGTGGVDGERSLNDIIGWFHHPDCGAWERLATGDQLSVACRAMDEYEIQLHEVLGRARAKIRRVDDLMHYWVATPVSDR